MNIYFAGSIRGGRDDMHTYADIMSALEKDGHKILTKHIGDSSLTAMGEKSITVEEIHRRNAAWMDQCDCVIAEVSTPSLGVGYEIAKLEALHKPILCLYRPSEEKSLSAMIAGSPDVQNATYTSPEEAQTHIADFLKRVSA